MYANKLAMAIKVNGKVLREHKDTVYLPFSSEYSILIKNLNTTSRALVNVYIDGENVTPNKLVIGPGQDIDLERSLSNGSLLAGNKFKFIERTNKIEDHRGIKIEDGLIRVEYQFETVVVAPPGIHYPYPSLPMYPGSPLRTTQLGQAWADPSITLTGSASTAVTGMNSATVFNSAVVQQSETGITVPGSKSNQKFTTVSGFPVESVKHSMILKMLGETEDNKAIREPITVKHKQKCHTCGKQNKFAAKFCNECGTSLEVYT